MPFDVQVIRAQEFIRIGPHGNLDLSASRQILQTLANACRKRGLESALLDLRDVRTDFGPEELATIVRMFREVGFSHGQKLALLHAGDPNRRARILAFLGSLRGWAVRAFGDFEEALEWLALAKDFEQSAATPVEVTGIEMPIQTLSSQNVPALNQGSAGFQI